jgi:hypothetical protein
MTDGHKEKVTYRGAESGNPPKTGENLGPNRGFLKSICKFDENKKSQHGCVWWALREHLSPPCYDFACGGLGDCPHINETKIWIFLGR